VTLVGVNGSSGSVEGVGSTARLDAPRGIDISADGSFALVSDASQHIVSLLSPPPLAAASETVAGVAGQTGSSDGTEAVARFNRPIGVSISDGGLVVIADTDNHTLRQATLITRTISTLAGAAGVAGSTDGSLAAARFNRPLGVSVNRTGLTILVADTGNHTIRLIYPRFGIVRTLAGSAGAPGSTNATGSLARFNTPYAIELSHNNKFALVVDTGNHTIRHITFPGGVVTTLAGMAGSRGSADGFGDRARFNRPVGLSLSRDDSFAIIADEGNGAIRRLNLATGQVTTLIKGLPTSLTGAQVAQFGDRPVLNTVLPCATNTALISNGSEQTISKLDLRTGELQPLLGKPNTPGAVDGIGEEARFNGPSDLTANCDDSDVVVISDTDNQLIRVIDTDTTFRVYAPLLRKYK
jgi:DNA-binding beta-propeller fold protein YncE